MMLAEPLEACRQPVLPVSVLLDNIRSLYNVGSFFRTADCAGAERLYLVGITGCPPHRGITKTALGAEQAVPWEHSWDPWPILNKLRSAGYQIAAIETTPDAIDLYEWEPHFPVCVIFGNELTGIQPGLLEASDVRVKIPTFGIKNSLNVATAGGIVLYELLHKYRCQQPDRLVKPCWVPLSGTRR